MQVFDIKTTNWHDPNEGNDEGVPWNVKGFENGMLRKEMHCCQGKKQEKRVLFIRKDFFGFAQTLMTFLKNWLQLERCYYLPELIRKTRVNDLSSHHVQWQYQDEWKS